MPQILQLPPMIRSAELRAASFSEADNTIECCWTTGATVRRMSWMDGPYDEELVVSANAVRLGRLNAGAPLLDTHADFSLKNVLGAVVPGSARIEQGMGFARIQLSKAPGDADTISKIKDGVIRNISNGYVYHSVEKTERDGSVPLWRVVDWEPLELSAVPVPADPGSQFRSAGADRAPPTYSCTIVGASAAEVARLKMRMTQRRAGFGRAA